MILFLGPNGPIGHRRFRPEMLQEPIAPRIPGMMTARPVVSALLLASAGVAGCWWIVTGMESWPMWLIFPAMLVAVIALGATVVGIGLLVVLALAPLIGRRDLSWHAEPLGMLGLPVAIRTKCEDLGFWTCEALSASIEQRRFPWTALEFDERMQVERAISRWRATSAGRQPEHS